MAVLVAEPELLLLRLAARAPLPGLAGAGEVLLRHQLERAAAEQLPRPVAQHVREVVVCVDRLAFRVDLPDAFLGRLHDLAEPHLALGQLFLLALRLLRRAGGPR